MSNLQELVMGLQLSLVGMFVASDSHMPLMSTRLFDVRCGTLLIAVGLGISLHAYFKGE